MKVVFLDIDGVLNSNEFYNECWDNYKFKTAACNWILDQRCLLRLYRLIDTTKAVIVLTSSWRISPVARGLACDQLRFYELTVYGATENNGKSRADQILDWVRANPGIEEYVILDDDVDDFLMRGMGEHLVLTDLQKGLTDNDVNAAISILLGKDKHV